MNKIHKPFASESTPNISYKSCGITLNIEHQHIAVNDFNELLKFANEKGVLSSYNAMRRGQIVNRSERRAALHTALRDPSAKAPFHKEVQEVLQKVCTFACDVRSGHIRGCRGDAITDVINVGIGGSEVGPKMVYQALRSTRQRIRLHFLAPADGVALDRIIGELNPFKTLVVISSKSFKTCETLVNATAINQWFLDSGITGTSRNCQLVVVSANPNSFREMNLPRENFFPIWEWVGGRFSVWSAIGLPVAIALGPEVFLALLSGAHSMDDHATQTPAEANFPLLLALIDYWNARKLNIKQHCILPYDERLRLMVDWLQQLEMESLGKHVDINGEFLEGATGQALWGGHGNESQHSFYQWLREGTMPTSIDLLWCEKPGHSHSNLHRVLLANVKAQTKALTTLDNINYLNVLTTITIDQLAPNRLGSLMAMYENKTTMLGTLYGINPFDQPGVEFGKKQAKTFLNRI